VRRAESVESSGTRTTGTFEEFFRAEHARLFGTLCLAAADRWEAEEIMQEAFVKLWERWDRVEGHPDPTAYLYRTAFNLFRSRLRRTARAARRTLLQPQPADPFEAIEDRQPLVAELRRLPRRQRMAVVLTDLVGMTSEEAAGLLGVKAVTARVLASQARAALREALGGTDG
jgi:RNA polymerase sigma-70 factor, ECF subfamily